MAKKIETIGQKLQAMIKENEKKPTSETAKKLASVHDAYNKLIAKGVFEKRGFTLRGIEDVHLLHLRPNN